MFSKNIYIFLFYCLTPISNPKPLNKEQGYPPSTRFFHTLQIIVLVFIYLKIKVKPIKACDRTTQLDTCGLYMFKCLHISQTPNCQLHQGWQWGIPKNIFLVITLNGFRWTPINQAISIAWIPRLGCQQAHLPSWFISFVLIFLLKKNVHYIYHKHIPRKKNSHPLILSPSKGSRCNSPHTLNYDYLLYNPILIHKWKIPLISLDWITPRLKLKPILITSWHINRHHFHIVMVDTIGFGEL
jgi:hypothetical protein